MPGAMFKSGISKPRKETIVVIDDNDRFLSTCERWLNTGGFVKVKCVKDGNAALKAVQSLKPDLLLIDIHLDKENDGLNLLQDLRAKGYQGLAVVISGDSSREQCFRAARAGANDFLLKRPHINVAEEISAIFERTGEPQREVYAASLSELGYLRSFGLTPREIEILEEYAVDYCSQEELGKRVNKAPSQVRKVFSRIYKKLGIESLPQLIHVLTSCAMFNSRG